MTNEAKRSDLVKSGKHTSVAKSKMKGLKHIGFVAII